MSKKIEYLSSVGRHVNVVRYVGSYDDPDGGYSEFKLIWKQINMSYSVIQNWTHVIFDNNPKKNGPNVNIFAIKKSLLTSPVNFLLWRWPPLLFARTRIGG